MEQRSLLDVPGAAERLAVSPHTIRAWIRQRRLPVVRLGRAIRFDPRQLDRFVRQRTVAAMANESAER